MVAKGDKKGKDNKEKDGVKEDKKPSYSKAVELPDTERFSTGFPTVDYVLGGGLVVRSLVELFGDESEGKTTFGFQILGKAQRDGYKTLFVDAEHSTLKEYLANFCDLTQLEMSEPVTAEDVFHAITDFYDKHEKEKNMILVDSVAAMSPEREMDADSPKVAELAALFSEKLRINVLNRYRNSIVIFTNQVRSKIDLRNPNIRAMVTPGGKALKFYAGYRIKLDTRNLIFRIQKDGSEEDVGKHKESIGKDIFLMVEKNKFGRPFLTTQLKMFFGKGFSVNFDVINWAMSKGVIVDNGSWIVFGDFKVQGIQNFMEAVEADDGLRGRIIEACSGPIVRTPL